MLSFLVGNNHVAAAEAHDPGPNRSVHLVLPSLARHDAVGNDAVGMRETLLDAGYSVRLIAQHIHDAYAPICEPFANARWDTIQPNDIVIYHHSVGWAAGERLLRRLRCKIVIRYHNVTPAHFFVPYAGHYAEACEAGRDATRALAGLCGATFWGASRFNCEELLHYGAPPSATRVLTPMHQIEALSREPLDMSLLAKYRARRPLILFVGGIKPNKGHLHLVRAFAALRRAFAEPATLILAGSYDPGLSSYYDAVRGLVQNLGVEQDVSFELSLSGSQIRTLYYLANVFLCNSEHEGFCVPLVEAMSFRIPIVAWDSTAIGETAREGAVLLNRLNPLETASALRECLGNPHVRASIGDRGRLRYETQFHPDQLRRSMFRLMGELEQTD